MINHSCLAVAVRTFNLTMASGSFPEVRPRHRFQDMSSSQEEEVLTTAVPTSTRISNEFWVRTLMSFAREKKINLDLNTCTAAQLNDCLKSFYFGLRTKNGKVYQRNSYVAARSAIQRQLTSLKRPFNLRCDSDFASSNRLLDTVLKKNKAEGKARPVQHKESISEADKLRLSEYFQDVLESDDTYKLQSYCWFNIARHYGLRGGEVFAKLRRQDLVFKRDGDGKEFVLLDNDFVTKNTPGGLNAREFHYCGRIQDDSQVKALHRLVDRLHPKLDRLFQRVLPGCRRKEGPWFAQAALGHNTLSDMMPLLSTRANLSMRYTNHCVRASVVTDLKDAGFSNHEVCAVTGHKNESSVQSYDRLDRAGSRRPADMADVLDGKPPAKRPCSAMVPSDQQPCMPFHCDGGRGRSASGSLPFGGILVQDSAVVHNITINFTRTQSENQQQIQEQHIAFSQN